MSAALRPRFRVVAALAVAAVGMPALAADAGVSDFVDRINAVIAPVKPDDRQAIRGILEHSQKSFTGAIKDPKRREYVFALVDTQKKAMRVRCVAVPGRSH